MNDNGFQAIKKLFEEFNRVEYYVGEWRKELNPIPRDFPAGQVTAMYFAKLTVDEANEKVQTWVNRTRENPYRPLRDPLLGY